MKPLIRFEYVVQNVLTNQDSFGTNGGIGRDASVWAGNPAGAPIPEVPRPEGLQIQMRRSNSSVVDASFAGEVDRRPDQVYTTEICHHGPR